MPLNTRTVVAGLAISGCVTFFGIFGFPTASVVSREVSDKKTSDQELESRNDLGSDGKSRNAGVDSAKDSAQHTNAVPRTSRTQQDHALRNAGSNAVLSNPKEEEPTSRRPDSARLPILVADSVANLLKNRAESPTGAPRSGNIGKLHETMESEDRDPNWAYAMEDEIRRFISSGISTPDAVINLIECRATMCEIQVTLAGGSVSMKWAILIGQMKREPWWTQNFSDSAMSGIASGPQMPSGMVTVFTRRSTKMN